VTDERAVGELLVLIDQLEDLLEHSGLSELEVEAAGTTLVLRKPSALRPSRQGPELDASEAGVPGAGGTARPPRGGSPGDADRTPSLPGAVQAIADPEPEDTTNVHAVVAPLTGVFYPAPSPGAAAYVRAGGPVAVGQVIGLIEAMKLFNEIKSDAAGTVKRIAAVSGALVKAGQPLIEVEPA